MVTKAHMRLTQRELDDFVFDFDARGAAKGRAELMVFRV